MKTNDCIALHQQIEVDGFYTDAVSNIKYQYYIFSEIMEQLLSNKLNYPIVVYYPFGQLIFYVFHNNNLVYHREDGAAYIDLSIQRHLYYYYGKFIGQSNNNFSQQDYERYLKTLCLR